MFLKKCSFPDKGVEKKLHKRDTSDLIKLLNEYVKMANFFA